ncbi:MAG: cupin domain-containing protein [Rhodovarius sp.]|nr:cupin domain-containing protein [Rhodovarius sp.]
MIVHPEEAEEHWQPQPANGWVRIYARTAGLSCGLQELPPLGKVREHCHPRHDEFFHVLEGEGLAKIGDRVCLTRPGSFLHIPPGIRHGFINAGDVPYRWFWWFSPPGLEEFFRAIGRPKRPGLPDPTPYPRPADVVGWELATVFAPLDPPAAFPWDATPITDPGIIQALRAQAG